MKSENTNLSYMDLPNININFNNKMPLHKLYNFIKKFSGKIIFSVESLSKREYLKKLLAEIDIQLIEIKNINDAYISGFYIIISTIKHGFSNEAQKIAVICENDIFGKQKIHNNIKTPKNIHTDIFDDDISEFTIGQPLVHIQHGVGRYQGLKILKTGDIKNEYLILAYANNDLLYVPVSSLNLISHYYNTNINNENAPLHKLGSNIWNKAKKKAIEKMRDTAAELLDIHAQRAIKPGFAFKFNEIQYQAFCKNFPFTTTNDQEQAIKKVLYDMIQPIAMDRLICGDVGFGKTEVAIRAAFLAINNNQQVAVLVPTTLLAKQHFDNFSARFSNWSTRIEMLSRLQTKKKQKEIITKITNGGVDIVIGTHKLLRNDIRWKKLRLLIIDEEHRFGVRHKELIKAIRRNIDILTLTATPIPRTLNTAMNGMRDLSIIATPPSCRLSVKTFVCQYNNSIVRKAIFREILRGGQVYYLFNDVKNIEKTKDRLAALVPEATFIIGHGKMSKIDLEHTMIDFYHHRFDVLICTTIIEMGIDIPSANTIIIERADYFGLAQLYQLRGRVGRSYHQAYAYFLISDPKLITVNAKKRLEAIKLVENLGSCFSLSTYDLEIRGAGELLGEEQSGHIFTIGYTLYTKLLKNAVNTLKQGKEPSLEEITNQNTEIELKIPLFFPENYIRDINIRLSFYKKIAHAKTEKELNVLKIEIIYRFGPLPVLAKQLIEFGIIRIQAHDLGIKKIEANEKYGFIEFHEKNKININNIIKLLENEPDTYRLDGKNKLKFYYQLFDNHIRLSFIKKLIKFLNN
ncbi:MAG: transcription-repair coupling factor [Arsenophonus sp.]|nr:MAG: transcription-repair coupling factor [Arsenophonus sp.]